MERQQEQPDRPNKLENLAEIPKPAHEFLEMICRISAQLVSLATLAQVLEELTGKRHQLEELYAVQAQLEQLLEEIKAEAIRQRAVVCNAGLTPHPQR